MIHLLSKRNLLSILPLQYVYFRDSSQPLLLGFLEWMDSIRKAVEKAKAKTIDRMEKTIHAMNNNDVLYHSGSWIVALPQAQ